jgi:hypothetical protein
MFGLEWDPNYVPPVKLGLHCAQIILTFVLWSIAIAVFRGEDAKIVGNNGWTFGVVSSLSNSSLPSVPSHCL